MRVPLSYLNQEFARGSALRDEIMAGIETLVDSGDFTLGKDVAAFEKEWAAAVGTEYAIGVRSGTDAIALALLAATGRWGDSPRPGGKAKVITTPLSFLATAGAILQAGAEPLFVDTDDRLQINTQRAGKMACGTNVAAVLPVSWAGEIPWDFKRIPGFEVGVPVILDAAQAIGCTWEGKPVAPLVTAAAYSLHPLKNINVWGDGGMVATNDPGIDRRIRSLRNHGLYGRDLWVEPGFNARLESIQAVVGRRVLLRLQDYTSKRRHNALLYDAQLADVPQVTIPPRHKDSGHVYHLYIVLCEKRDELIAYLNDKGVEARAHYPIPLHLQPALRSLGHRPGDFPNAEYQAAHCVSLPVHQYLSEDQIGFACEKVREFYGYPSPVTDWMVYRELVIGQLDEVHSVDLGELVEGLHATKAEGGTVFVLGNGGSQANAAHLVLHLRQKGYRAIDMLGDSAWLTAESNDHGYAFAPARMLGQHSAGPKDTLFVISGSGCSMNTIYTLEGAKVIGVRCLGLLGFGGGEAGKFIDGVVLPSNHYGAVEDVHSAIIHYLATVL